MKTLSSKILNYPSREEVYDASRDQLLDWIENLNLPSSLEEKFVFSLILEKINLPVRVLR